MAKVERTVLRQENILCIPTNEVKIKVPCEDFYTLLYFLINLLYTKTYYYYEFYHIDLDGIIMLGLEYIHRIMPNSDLSRRYIIELGLIKLTLSIISVLAR